MFKVNTSRTKRTCVTLTHVFEFFNFSECLCGSVLKDYLGESRTLFNLNKLAGKVEKSDIYRSTVISMIVPPKSVKQIAKLDLDVSYQNNPWEF